MVQTKSKVESCPEIPLAPEALCIYQKGTLWSGNNLQANLGRRRSPGLQGVKIELMGAFPFCLKAAGESKDSFQEPTANELQSQHIVQATSLKTISERPHQA